MWSSSGVIQSIEDFEQFDTVISRVTHGHQFADGTTCYFRISENVFEAEKMLRGGQRDELL